MPSNDERRKNIRADLPTGFYFNILPSPDDFNQNKGAVIRQMSAIDSAKIPVPTTETQIFLSRIDQKLSLIISMMAEQSNQKNYLNYGQVIDISESGLSFGHHLKFETGTFLEIGLQLSGNDNRILDIPAHIVHTKPPLDADPTFAAIYGVEFTDIQGKDQNDIVQWIFSYQREQIRRRRAQNS